MRILPLALIAVGAFELLKHYGLIDPAFWHLFWPLLLIGIGVVMLVRGPRWRQDMRARMQDRWERRLHRRFGPGWAKLSEEERERFRAGMRQWHAGSYGDAGAGPFPPAPGGEASTPKGPPQAPTPGEPR